MTTHGLIFDFDGTLADTMPTHYLALCDVLAVHGLELGEDEFYAQAGRPTRLVIADLAVRTGVTVDPAQIAREKEDAFLRRLSQIQVVPPVAEIVRREHGRTPLALATGAVRRVLNLVLPQIGFESVFDAIVTADDTERHKPFPDVFLEAARQLGVPPEQCRVYEDADLGIEAARAAGMEVIDIREFYTPRRVTV